jgi:glutamate/tyrosine decarboxylase-like PLP-dependent enzyme
MAVGVFGTTEYGTVDKSMDSSPRATIRHNGLGFSVHVDAARGGYLATMFTTRRQPAPARSGQRGIRRVSVATVHAAVAAIGRTDSVTVDPHKLGYLPYGAGAFICRDHRAMALLSEEADYVFHGITPQDYLTRYRSLGQYIPEGSKSGAMAAAVYVTHKVLPLDHRHFGQLPRQTILNTEAFHGRALRFAQEIAGDAQVLVPFAPDSNLVCLALNPRGSTSGSDPSGGCARQHGLRPSLGRVIFIYFQNDSCRRACIFASSFTPVLCVHPFHALKL